MSAPLISSIEKNHYIVLFCKHPLLFKVSREVLSCLFISKKKPIAAFSAKSPAAGKKAAPSIPIFPR
jgi:hypothetical protein